MTCAANGFHPTRGLPGIYTRATYFMLNLKRVKKIAVIFYCRLYLGFLFNIMNDLRSSVVVLYIAAGLNIQVLRSKRSNDT